MDQKADPIVMGTGCPLCHSTRPEPFERIAIEDLDYFYRQMFDLPVLDHFHGIQELTFHFCQVCGLKYFYPQIGGSGQFYLSLNRHPWYYLEDKSEYRTAALVVPCKSKVLDVGCGSGKFARSISSCDYVGLEKNLVDYQPKSDYPRILPEYIEEHVLNHEEEYDVVCAFQVLEHIPNVSTFIESSLRCLKPGGLLIISVPSADSFISKTVNGVLNMPPHHLTWWPDVALEYISTRYDLELVRIVHAPIEKIHYRRYAFNWALTLISKVFRKRYRLIDRTTGFRILGLLLLPLAMVQLFLIWMNAGSTVGHSVVALYRKGK